MLSRTWLSLLFLVGCGSASGPNHDAAPLTIIDENNSVSEPPAKPPELPPELMVPSSDPVETCLRVATRLEHCNKERAAVLAGLEPTERSQADAALADAATAIETMREQCRGPLDDKETAYVQAMGRCLGLSCTSLGDCVSRAP